MGVSCPQHFPLVAARSEGVGEMLGPDLAEHDVAVGHGERSAAPGAGGSRHRAGPVRADPEQAHYVARVRDCFLEQACVTSAFGAADGRAYTVATFVDEVEGEARGRFGAALVFVAWEPGGDRPAGHPETQFLAFGASPAPAEAPLLALPRADVKARLDTCVERR